MISDNDSEKVKTALIKAEEAVKNIKDTSLKSKAFELAFAKFLNNEKEPDKNINLLINNKEMSIKEVLLKTKARFDTEKVLIFGYFLEKYKHFSSFTMKDIKRCYFDAKEKPPLNISDKINLNIHSGLLMELSEKKGRQRNVTLTRKGVQHVKDKLMK